MKTKSSSAREAKYLQIAGQVRKRIESGELKPGDRLPSFSQMMAESGVMPTTFDRSLAVLQQEGLIVREHGRGVFVADTQQKARYVIALSPRILLDKHDPYWDNLLRGIHESALHNQLEIVFMAPNQTTIPERVHGMIVHEGTTENFRSVAEDFPFVSLMVPSKGAYCVASDDYSGGRFLAQHLLDLGHRRIAVLMLHPIKSTLVGLRMQGYRDALSQANLDFDESIVRMEEIANADNFNAYSVASHRKMKEWLAGGWAELGCTAIMAYNDAAAVGIIRALNEAGLRVPEDVSVVGFDGNSIFDFFQPHLTTARVHLQEIGRAGADLLVRHLQGETDLPRLTHIGPSLVTGNSTGPCPNIN